MTRHEFWQGNTACAEGALAAGCRFFGGYPITPSTEIAEHMARRMPKVDGVFVQMEDELASMASIIGASWAGMRSMTATSGPGFSLMMENIGYAIMTETPCVVVDVQRGGPSTGQPTRASQGDMMQCRFGSHGDISIIAVSPASVQEMYELTAKAFNLADRYRVPTFVMTDEIIGHMRERIDIPESVDITPRRPLEKGTLPFAAGEDGVPGFPAFGHGHGVHVTGLTHDERGYPSTTDPHVHEALVRRLVEKVEGARREMADFEAVHPDAEVVFISYGAPARSVAQVIRDMDDERVGHLRLRVVWPFPEFALEIFTSARVFLVPELNLGQIALEAAARTNVPVVPIPEIGGELHMPERLIEMAEGYL
ncbi:2-oxoacid:acceptor oxidoreductase subunit alpha [Methanofollis fontis]|uniref:2-oxoglutarate synthase subunit KorA n=1 Tax=Methanofollis fontis TaxID=2052832 RepID=A0A483CNP7_9EURY|nr:2-oxoacid:acceptor oxidoreductase subunit alpha [Methanofollis fontis]TAJ44620.1 2-oxoglutarate synthase subunit alpha [Methanofollis fontis]